MDLQTDHLPNFPNRFHSFELRIVVYSCNCSRYFLSVPLWWLRKVLVSQRDLPFPTRSRRFQCHNVVLEEEEEGESTRHNVSQLRHYYSCFGLDPEL